MTMQRLFDKCNMLAPLARRWLRYIFGVLLGFALAALIAFNIVLLWVAAAPRSLARLTPYIESSLSSASRNYKVRVGETWLLWDGWRHPLDLRLKDVTVLTKDGQIFSSFPQISLGVDMLALPFGEFLPTSITIAHPVINLMQNEDRSISFGFQQSAAAPQQAKPLPPQATPSAPFAAAVAPLLMPDNASGLRRLHYIRIVDADVTVESARHGVFFQANHASITFHRTFLGIVQATADATINYGTYQSQLSAKLSMKEDSPTVDGEFVFTSLMPGTLAALFTDNDYLSALKFPASGKVLFSFSRGGNLQHADFIFDGGRGAIVCSRLAAPIPVTQFHAEGEAGNNGNDIALSRLTANLGGMLVEAKGNARLAGNDVAIDADATLKNVPAANVAMLWPPQLSPQSRQWVIDNIKGGMVTDTEAKLRIPFGDLAKPGLPKGDVDARITIDNADIRYLPGHPDVTHAKGVVHVDGESLEADIASGSYMRDTRLTNGKLLIADLNADNPYIVVGFDADVSARDAVRMLTLPRLNHAAAVNLREDAVRGDIRGHASLGFHFFTPPGMDPDADITYDVSATLKDAAAQGFMKKFDIAHADGTLTIKNSGLEYKGVGNVNGANASSADVRYLFDVKKGFDTFIDVTAEAPVESLPKFGYPAFPFLKGTLGVKASLKESDTEESDQATIDLTDAAVDWKEMVWSKPEGEKASLSLSAEKQNGVLAIPAFHLTGKDMEAKGSAQLDKALSAIQRICVSPLKHGVTDITSLTYALIPGGWKLEATGASADISGFLIHDKDTPDTFSFEHFPAVQLKEDIGQVTLGKDRRINNVKGTLDCTMQRCDTANISGKTADGKPFFFRILKNPKGQRQLSVHAESAGAFLKAIGVFDGMQGGDLTVIGDYNDTGAASALSGALDINEHVVKNAPILARILSLASLTGFFDTLQGNGIHFDRLRVPFTLVHDVITIKDAKTHGDALGMTAEGTITFPKRILNIEGTIVPSYTLNHIVGDVPLVGHLLTGGEGQGLFAARYSVRGPESNPDVTVNPLSLLTPGFLRGVFDIFDLPDKSSDTTQKLSK